jgi:hypothetical protein
MRDAIRRVTETDVRELGEKWGIDVAHGEAAEMAERVGDRLADDLDAVFDVPVPSGASDPGERPWSEGTDRYNAIRVDCRVPPTADAGDLLDGVTVGLKDLIAVASVPMRCGSTVMDGFVPSTDAATTTGSPAAPPAEAGPPSRPGSSTSRSVPTPADRPESRRPSAASSASSPRTGSCPSRA